MIFKNIYMIKRDNVSNSIKKEFDSELVYNEIFKN